MRLEIDTVTILRVADRVASPEVTHLGKGDGHRALSKVLVTRQGPLCVHRKGTWVEQIVI